MSSSSPHHLCRSIDGNYNMRLENECTKNNKKRKRKKKNVDDKIDHANCLQRRKIKLKYGN